MAMAPMIAFQQWRKNTKAGRILSILLTVWICRLHPPFMWDEESFWIMLACMIATAVMAVNWFSLSSEKGDLRWKATFLAVVATCGFSSITNAIICYQSLDQLSYIGDSLTMLFVSLRITGDFLPLVIAGFIIGLVISGQSSSRGILFRATAFAAVAVGIGAWVRTSTDAPRDTQCLPVVRESLGSHDRLPNVYWPTDIQNIWFGIPARSYYHFVQVQGAIFRRETAIEAKRRIDLVRPFEMRELRSLGLFIPWRRLGRVYGPTERSKPVVEADLIKLASEPDLDYIVLPYDVPPLSSKHEDGIWIYDCAAIRDSLRSKQSDQTTFFPLKENAPSWNP